MVLKEQTRHSHIQAKALVPPNAVEAELSVLGGLLLDSERWDDINLLLTEADFYRSESQTLFTAIKTLKEADKTVDILTLVDYLKSIDKLDDCGGEAFVYEISNNTPSVANLLSYAELVKEKALQRKLLATTNEIRDKTFQPQGMSADELLEYAESKIFSLSDNTKQADIELSAEQAVNLVIDKVHALYNSDESFVGIETGFTVLDKMLSGLRKKDLIVIAGRPSMGKTTFALNIVQHVLMTLKQPVLFASIEMDAAQLIEKIISSMENIKYNHIETGKLKEEDWEGFSQAVSKIHKAKLTTLDTGMMTPSLLRSYARRVKRKYKGLGLIVVDYLQLMQIPGFRENRTLEISTISRSLKLLAKELDVPVLALSQLNRGLETRTDKRPVMADLRDSGAIEQDADVVGFIYRDEVYNENSEDKGKAELIIAKNRKGQTGKVVFKFNGAYSKFQNLPCGLSL